MAPGRLRRIRCETKPMGIVAAKGYCYTLFAFIAVKMELHWRWRPLLQILER